MGETAANLISSFAYRSVSEVVTPGSDASDIANIADVVGQPCSFRIPSDCRHALLYAESMEDMSIYGVWY